MSCGIGGISSERAFDRNMARTSAYLEALLTSRGTDSFGWFDGHTITKEPGDFTKSNAYEVFDNILMSERYPVYRTYLHTRAATQGDPEINKNNHPFNMGDLFMAHNGSFFSWDDFRNPWGIECDSFPLLYWIYTEKLENSLDTIDAIEKGLEHVTGQYAIWLYDKDTKKTYLFRNRSAIFTLFYWEGPDVTIFASEKEMVEKTARMIGYSGTPITRVKPYNIYVMEDRNIEKKKEFSGRRYNVKDYSRNRERAFFPDRDGSWLFGRGDNKDGDEDNKGLRRNTPGI